MPSSTASKTEILDEAGYAYSFDRGMYINLKTKKAFSVEFVQDHSEHQIRECIRQRTDLPEWQFYFNAEPSDAVKQELVGVLS